MTLIYQQARLYLAAAVPFYGSILGLPSPMSSTGATPRLGRQR